METFYKKTLTVECVVLAPIEKVWKFWTIPDHITKWNNASDDWHTTFAENDLRAGNKFLYRMEAKDRSFGFDFSSIYDEVIMYQLIAYSLGDGRKVINEFTSDGTVTKVSISFEAENMNSLEIQKGGWQAILDNFKKYVAFN